MRSPSAFLFTFISLFSTLISAGPAYTGPYDNDFINPTYFFSGHLSKTTIGAQRTVVEWADHLNTQGPWSVMNKTILPPSGNKHDYMSWAPYFWPNCIGVGNTTELTPEEVWTQCPYVYYDGQVNPDRLLVNDTGSFGAMADAVFYNAIAWVLTGTSAYATKAAHYIDTWFINPDTSMTPNLNYGQMERGPDGQVGTRTGLLDLRCMAKVTTAILIFRRGSSPAWTSGLDSKMVNWTTKYLEWMQTSPISIQERTSTNNLGTYYYNEWASNQILVGDLSGAAASIREYFSNQYLNQINANGEQPLERVRAHPYHYRAFNLAAMIVNARIGEYLGKKYWNTPTRMGGNIQKACDFLMTAPLNTTSGDGPIYEPHSSIAAVGSEYGDPHGKYSSFLASVDPQYPAQPYFLWNQPFYDSGLPAATSGGPLSTSTSVTHKSDASKAYIVSGLALVISNSIVFAALM